MWWIISIVLFVVALAVATSFCIAGSKADEKRLQLFNDYLKRKKRDEHNRSGEETHDVS